MAQKATDWKRSLWDHMHNHEIRAMLEKLPEELSARLLHELNPSPDKLRAIGWKEVCSGCGKETSTNDCGCPAGTGWKPPFTKE